MVGMPCCDGTEHIVRKGGLEDRTIWWKAKAFDEVTRVDKWGGIVVKVEASKLGEGINFR
jgi:hypothetical protein